VPHLWKPLKNSGFHKCSEKSRRENCDFSTLCTAPRAAITTKPNEEESGARRRSPVPGNSPTTNREERVKEGCREAAVGWFKKTHSLQQHYPALRSHQPTSCTKPPEKGESSVPALFQISSDRFLEVPIELHRGVIVKREYLDHQHACDLPFGIHPEVRVEDSCPCITARGPQIGVFLV